jgi:FeS assembly SUF system protein
MLIQPPFSDKSPLTNDEEKKDNPVSAVQSALAENNKENVSSLDLSELPVYSAKEKGFFVPGDNQIPVTQAELTAALKEVNDPELMLNIYDLGLVYKTDISDEGDVFIEMTLTSPLCPMADMMPQMVAQRVALLDGVREVSVSLVWEPVWTMDKMSEEYKLMLNLF